MEKDHLLADLNAEQRRAVTLEGGPMLVVAGAGSGKTRVITRRIAWLLAGGVPEGAILGVTFTNKAAKEMAERVQELIPESGIRLSTFHSACAAFLRRSAHLLGFGHDFTIYDTQDRDLLIKSLMREHDVSAKQVTPSSIGSLISKLKNEGVRPEEYDAASWIPLQHYVGVLYGPYQESLAAMNAMDFDDLLLHFLRILDEYEHEREKYAERFQHVLVDEFQDTNTIQYRIVRRLAEKHGNLCVVGDPDQSIYSFRGAQIDNIMSFPQDFPETVVVKLETNYRSTANILDFAQSVISHNENRFEKTLVAHLPEGDPVAYKACESNRAEARDVAYKVRDLLDRDVGGDEIAVFYRARFLSRVLEESFRMVGVPYDIIGDVGFFARREIKDLCGFLQVCVNPKDGVGMRRILNVPPRGIGKVSQERIFAEAARWGLGAAELILKGVPVPGVSGKAARGLQELTALLAEGQVLAADSVEQTLRFFIDRTGYREHVCGSGSAVDAERSENIDELITHAREFDRELAELGATEGRREHAVGAYLTRVCLLSDTYGHDEDGAVQLMTVHAAKGLEFDHVFVIGLEDGVFPHRQSLDAKEDLEEERRLFYVAATRARKALTITRAEFRESPDRRPQDNLPSRFLYESGLEEKRRTFGESSYDVRHDAAEDAWEDAEPVYQYRQIEEPEDEPSYTGGSQEFREGDRVRHESFGEGTILRCFGVGRSAKVEVMFASGVRILLLEYANLERSRSGGEQT